MTNLTPPQIQKTAQRAYYIRVATVWSFLIACAFLVGVAALVPSYVLVSTQAESLSSYISDTNTNRVAYKKAVAELSESEDLAQFIRSHTFAPLAPLVDAVMQHAGSGVTISEVRLARDDDTFDPLTIRGSADTREALVAYRDMLRDHEYFSEVTLPLGNLVGESGLTFAITSYVANTYEGS